MVVRAVVRIALGMGLPGDRTVEVSEREREMNGARSAAASASATAAAPAGDVALMVVERVRVKVTGREESAAASIAHAPLMLWGAGLMLAVDAGLRLAGSRLTGVAGPLGCVGNGAGEEGAEASELLVGGGDASNACVVGW